MAKKERLDIMVQQSGLAETREKAQALIMSGNILVNGNKIDKNGTKVPVDAEIVSLAKEMPFVSRGGYKLDHAFEVFPIDMTDAVVCDIGASTGGFVDCALQRGAQRVYAVDVGYGQLDWKLRNDPRVINMEKTNGRHLTADDFPELMDWVTTDVAFISLEKIFPAAARILKADGAMIALIKPQFEAGPDDVGKNGVVRDKSVHKKVIQQVLGYAIDVQLYPVDLAVSPIQGPKGNIEYLLWLKKEKQNVEMTPDTIDNLVEGAFQHFSKVIH